MNQPIVVTGIQTGIPPHPTEIDYPVRQEWSKFAASRDNVTLYVKALEAMMDLPQDSFPPVSFFQISGFFTLYSIFHPDNKASMDTLLMFPGTERSRPRTAESIVIIKVTSPLLCIF